MEGRSNSILHILKYCATLLCGRTEPFPCINNKSLQKIRTLRNYKYISDWINPSLLPQQLVGERTSRFIWTETIPFIGLIFNNTSILIFKCVCGWNEISHPSQHKSHYVFVSAFCASDQLFIPWKIASI